MCNNLNKNAKPIPKTGYGWKLFETLNGSLISYIDGDSYEKLKNGKIRWINNSNMDGDGFCFFRNKKSATLVKKHFGYSGVIKKIRYEGGLGVQSYVHGSPQALCKKFTILDEG